MTTATPRTTTTGRHTRGVDALAAAFAGARAERRAALIPFLAAADPSPAEFVRVARAVARAGADVLEVGLPYADSLADGPTIQAAYARALAQVDTAGALESVGEVARAVDVPVVLMCAYNPVRARGVDRFVETAAALGVAGLIVPDLPLEEGAALRRAAAAAGVACVQLIAPDSGDERAARIARASTGFVYVVRRRGVTGAGGAGAVGAATLGAVRAATGLPIALGFGIATPEDAARAAAAADAVIVGSALVDRIAHEHAAGGSAARIAAEHVHALRAALAAGPHTDPKKGIA